MALTATPVFPQTPKSYTATITNATSTFTITNIGTSTVTGLVSVATIGTNGSIIEAINVASTDSVSHSLVLAFLPTGGVLYLLATVTIPASSGAVAGTPPVSLLNSTNIPGTSSDANGNRFLYIPASGLLYVGVLTTAVTSPDVISVVATGADF